ncbi:hypothetical protein MKL09_05930 [Methylobacterium sp. J-048]|uniref:hypothetical protein n=1 Tax=Methylobacterium sp. J-048 TaxID=2836635 RepID=UPI001FBB51BF|nr:hypothetical protein [Methylobacterium sp. J-048]MCJ2056086.1 hypothetical protein [Methylobacterium sp. J-048]
MPSDAELKLRLEATFRQLVPRADAPSEHIEMTINSTVGLLWRLRGASSSKTPALYINADFVAAEKERIKIAKLSKDLVAALSNMHAPTFQLFADNGLMKNHIESTINDLNLLKDNSSKLKIKKSITGATKGRPRNNKNHMIRAILGKTFHDVTGRTPNRGSPFKEICYAVADILELDVEPGGFARQAYNDYRNKHRTPTKME